VQNLNRGCVVHLTFSRSIANDLHHTGCKVEQNKTTFTYKLTILINK
jgi:hypothetical protein